MKVTRPKVEGSIYLDELFQDTSLDFFVFFSSLAAVTGNLGQSNYSAANCFMSGLAEQRRQKGLAASVINIGPVLESGTLPNKNWIYRVSCAVERTDSSPSKTSISTLEKL